jgi:hypothetical protein
MILGPLGWIIVIVADILLLITALSCVWIALMTAQIVKFQLVEQGKEAIHSRSMPPIAG